MHTYSSWRWSCCSAGSQFFQTTISILRPIQLARVKRNSSGPSRCWWNFIRIRILLRPLNSWRISYVGCWCFILGPIRYVSSSQWGASVKWRCWHLFLQFLTKNTILGNENKRVQAAIYLRSLLDNKLDMESRFDTQGWGMGWISPWFWLRYCSRRSLETRNRHNVWDTSPYWRGSSTGYQLWSHVNKAMLNHMACTWLLIDLWVVSILGRMANIKHLANTSLSTILEIRWRCRDDKMHGRTRSRDLILEQHHHKNISLKVQHRQRDFHVRDIGVRE